MATGKKRRTLGGRLSAATSRFLGGAKPPENGKVEYARLNHPTLDIRLRASTRKERLRARACAHEPWTVEWIECWMGAGETLWDIGANVGAYSLIAASQRSPARVFAFEPAPENYAALCHNVAANSLSAQVVTIPLAVGDRTAVGTMVLRGITAGAGAHSLAPTESGGAVADDAVTQRVLTVTIDDLISEFGLPAPHHLKIDVEGGEPAVLSGARNLLASGVMRSLMVELSPELERRLVTDLEAFGFELFQLFRGRKEGKVSYGLFRSLAHAPGPKVSGKPDPETTPSR